MVPLSSISPWCCLYGDLNSILPQMLLTFAWAVGLLHVRSGYTSNVLPRCKAQQGMKTMRYAARPRVDNTRAVLALWLGRTVQTSRGRTRPSSTYCLPHDTVGWLVECCFTSTETVRLIRVGSPGRPPRLSHSS